MAKLFANSGDPDQMPHSAASRMRRLIWVCTVCHLPFYGSPDYNGLSSHFLKYLVEWQTLLAYAIWSETGV